MNLLTDERIGTNSKKRGWRYKRREVNWKGPWDSGRASLRPKDKTHRVQDYEIRDYDLFSFITLGLSIMVGMRSTFHHTLFLNLGLCIDILVPSVK